MKLRVDLGIEPWFTKARSSSDNAQQPSVTFDFQPVLNSTMFFNATRSPWLAFGLVFVTVRHLVLNVFVRDEWVAHPALLVLTGLECVGFCLGFFARIDRTLLRKLLTFYETYYLIFSLTMWLVLGVWSLQALRTTSLCFQFFAWPVLLALSSVFSDALVVLQNGKPEIMVESCCTNYRHPDVARNWLRGLSVILPAFYLGCVTITYRFLPSFREDWFPHPIKLLKLPSSDSRQLAFAGLSQMAIFFIKSSVNLVIDTCWQGQVPRCSTLRVRLKAELLNLDGASASSGHAASIAPAPAVEATVEAAVEEKLMIIKRWRTDRGSQINQPLVLRTMTIKESPLLEPRDRPHGVGLVQTKSDADKPLSSLELPAAIQGREFTARRAWEKEEDDQQPQLQPPSSALLQTQSAEPRREQPAGSMTTTPLVQLTAGGEQWIDMFIGAEATTTTMTTTTMKAAATSPAAPVTFESELKAVLPAARGAAAAAAPDTHRHNRTTTTAGAPPVSSSSSSSSSLDQHHSLTRVHVFKPLLGSQAITRFGQSKGYPYFVSAIIVFVMAASYMDWLDNIPLCVGIWSFGGWIMIVELNRCDQTMAASFVRRFELWFVWFYVIQHNIYGWMALPNYSIQSNVTVMFGYDCLAAVLSLHEACPGIPLRVRVVMLGLGVFNDFRLIVINALSDGPYDPNASICALVCATVRSLTLMTVAQVGVWRFRYLWQSIINVRKGRNELSLICFSLRSPVIIDS